MHSNLADCYVFACPLSLRWQESEVLATKVPWGVFVYWGSKLQQQSASALVHCVGVLSCSNVNIVLHLKAATWVSLCFVGFPISFVHFLFWLCLFSSFAFAFCYVSGLLRNDKCIIETHGLCRWRIWRAFNRSISAAAVNSYRCPQVRVLTMNQA